MSTVSDVTSTYDVSPSSTGSYSSSTSSLGKNEFLNLLVTQMKYQDPLEPTDDTEFIAQMAQFSSLEQMQNLNDSFNKYKAYDLVGKNVDATVNGTAISGFIESIRFNSDGIYAIIDGSSVDIDNITKVNDTAEDLQVMVSILEHLANVSSKLDSLIEITNQKNAEVSDEDTTVDEVTDDTTVEEDTEEVSDAEESI